MEIDSGAFDRRIIKKGKRLIVYFTCGFCECEFTEGVKACVSVCEVYNGSTYKTIFKTDCPCCGQEVTSSDVKEVMVDD